MTDKNLGATPRRSKEAGSIAPSAATARHTPGPWRPAVGDRWRREPGEVDLAVVEHDGYDAVEIYAPRRSETLQEHEANIHLIAAAPELLEALRAALDWGLMDYGTQAQFEAIHDKIEAAIAKAEGR